MYFIKDALNLNNLFILDEKISSKKFELVTARALMDIKNFLNFLKENNINYKFFWVFFKDKFINFKFKEIVKYYYNNKLYFQAIGNNN